MNMRAQEEINYQNHEHQCLLLQIAAVIATDEIRTFHGSKELWIERKVSEVH